MILFFVSVGQFSVLTLIESLSTLSDSDPVSIIMRRDYDSGALLTVCVMTWILGLHCFQTGLYVSSMLYRQYWFKCCLWNLVQLIMNFYCGDDEDVDEPGCPAHCHTNINLQATN